MFCDQLDLLMSKSHLEISNSTRCPRNGPTMPPNWLKVCRVWLQSAQTQEWAVPWPTQLQGSSSKGTQSTCDPLEVLKHVSLAHFESMVTCFSPPKASRSPGK